MDEAERIARYAPENDAEGLLAYTLHRQALLAFRADYAARHARPPEAAEEEAFLIGEDSAGRIAAYRRDAAAKIAAEITTRSIAQPPASMGSSATASPAPKKRVRWPFFGQWIEPPATYNPDQPVNWRGLVFRLITLLLAVVGTAVLLRVLVVKGLE